MTLNSEISKITGYISTLVVILPLVAGIIKNKTLSKEQRVLFFFIIASALADLLLFVLGHLSVNNYFILHIFTPVEFILLSAVYYCDANSKKIKIFLGIVMILFVTLAVADLFFIDKLTKFDTISSATESLLLMVYALVFFFYLLKKLEYKNVFDNPMFWFNSGVLIYFLGNFFLFIFCNYILTVSDSYFNKMWVIHDPLNISMTILFGIALWKR